MSNTRFPTLLHLGATYGLTLTVAACLHYCPAAHQACLLKNVDGNTPIEISRKLGSHEITKCLQDFQVTSKILDKELTMNDQMVITCILRSSITGQRSACKWVRRISKQFSFLWKEDYQFYPFFHKKRISPVPFHKDSETFCNSTRDTCSWDDECTARKIS